MFCKKNLMSQCLKNAPASQAVSMLERERQELDLPAVAERAGASFHPC